MLPVPASRLTNCEQLLTPALLLFPERVRHNLEECIRLAGSADRLRPHVKTHKCAAIVRMQLEAGITKHKCATLAEARMLAECGAAQVLVAYPLVGPAVAVLADLVAAYPSTRFAAVVEDLPGAERLSAHFEERQMVLEVLIDIDTGMHRTGVAPGSTVVELAEQLARWPSLQLVGLHVYDGQNHLPSLAERQSAVTALMQPVLHLVGSLRQLGLPVDTLVCGGTPTFPVFADLELPDDLHIECSPGTCILSDLNYSRDYPDMSGFQTAAWLVTRVVSKQHTHQLTVDLGHKALAGDPSLDQRGYFPDLPDARFVQHNEEHLVLESPAADRYSVGDILYALPGHICPTVALHSHFLVVEQGQIQQTWEISARNRIYQAGTMAVSSASGS